MSGSGRVGAGELQPRLFGDPAAGLWVTAWPGAVDALAAAVARAKQGDPLAPVTVVVPSAIAGLAARRALGSRPGGVANVRFAGFVEVLEELAPEPRTPVLTTAAGLAITAGLLAERPGALADVAAEGRTLYAIGAALQALRGVPAPRLDALARCGRVAATLADLAAAYQRATAHLTDRDDLARAALGRLSERRPLPAELGHLVLHAVMPERALERQLVLALAATGRLSAVIAVTGEPALDGPEHALAAELTASLGAPVATPEPVLSEPPEIVIAPDPATEARLAARHVADAIDRGVPAHRVAILTNDHRREGPRIIAALERLGIASHGPNPRSLAQSAASRTLLGALDAAESGLRRDDVAVWLTGAPLTSEGRAVPGARWARLAREAGVVAGRAQWADRLTRHRRSLERQAADAGEVLGYLGDELDALAAFVEVFAERLLGASPTTWSGFAQWGRELVGRFLDPSADHVAWPDDEVAAAAELDRILGVLASLDAVATGPVDRAAFRHVLEGELARPMARRGRFGQGVFVAPVRHAVGVRADVVVVVGMTDAGFPSRPPIDALLGPRERVAAGLELEAPDEHRRRQERALAAATAGAAVTYLLPTVDPAGRNALSPSPWLLARLGRVRGAVVTVDDLLATPESFGARRVASHHEQVRRWPASEDDVLSAALLCRNADDVVAGDALLARRLAAARSRATLAFDEHAGAIGSLPHLDLHDTTMSATRLERYSRCPGRYFLERVLGLGEDAEPTEPEVIEPRDRGSIVHAVLDRLFRTHAPSAGQPWSAEARAAARELVEQHCRRAEDEGRTGWPLLWRLERARIQRDVRHMLQNDDIRLLKGFRPVASELAFGFDDEPHVVVELPNGRVVRFRGFVDRIDASSDGDRLVVIDYKTGAPVKPDAVKAGVARGELLQLPIYGRAVAERAARWARPDAAVEAGYWYLGVNGRPEPETIPLEEMNAAFERAVEVTTGAVANGLFPFRPGEPAWNSFRHCRYCQFDRICPPERDRLWRTARTAPGLAAYVELVEGPSTEEESA